mmetsp:Transcript_15906/g.43966  ORF Transcript_15906/g.43966 Transcript_15906/m.43966 type:complete len:214 (+) Transcript_15906:227-868(+)
MEDSTRRSMVPSARSILVIVLNSRRPSLCSMNLLFMLTERGSGARGSFFLTFLNLPFFSSTMPNSSRMTRLYTSNASWNLATRALLGGCLCCVGIGDLELDASGFRRLLPFNGPIDLDVCGAMLLILFLKRPGDEGAYPTLGNELRLFACCSFCDLPLFCTGGGGGGGLVPLLDLPPPNIDDTFCRNRPGDVPRCGTDDLAFLCGVGGACCCC